MGDPRHRELAGSRRPRRRAGAVVAEPADDLVVGRDPQPEVLDQPRAHLAGPPTPAASSGPASVPAMPIAPSPIGAQTPTRSAAAASARCRPVAPEQPVAAHRSRARRRRRTRSVGASPMARPETGNGVGARHRVVGARRGSSWVCGSRRGVRRAAGAASSARASTATEPSSGSRSASWCCDRRPPVESCRNPARDRATAVLLGCLHRRCSPRRRRASHAPGPGSRRPRQGRAGQHRDDQRPRPRPGRGAGPGPGVRRVPHRPALPRGRRSTTTSRSCSGTRPPVWSRPSATTSPRWPRATS